MRNLVRWLPAATLLILSSCGGTSGSAAQGSPSPDPVRGDLSVFAAASLTESFTAAGKAFKKQHPGVNLQFNFAGTPTLVTQLQQGAAADVLASADQANMQRATDASLVLPRARIFTRNKLQIVVGPNNPKHITGLSDLAKSDVLFIAEAPTVPAGKYGAQALAAAGVKVSPRSQEADVRSVVSKVGLGEADAGIVYVTDVKAAGSRVSGVEIPDPQNVVATYPVAAVRDARNAAAASEFIDYLLSAEGQMLLTRFGFGHA
ncbi:MAG: molybdate ABC transporter substrate-binding protein [Candidatus Dormibacteria bacterium]